MRTTVYIDGFNLYFAMRRLKDKSLYWLDLYKLGQKLAGEPKINCKYFTSRIGGPNKAKRDRQNLYIEALEATGKVEIILGGYSTIKIGCPNWSYARIWCLRGLNRWRPLLVVNA